jgi:hypothetical protein
LCHGFDYYQTLITTDRITYKLALIKMLLNLTAKHIYLNLSYLLEFIISIFNMCPPQERLSPIIEAEGTPAAPPELPFIVSEWSTIYNNTRRPFFDALPGGKPTIFSGSPQIICSRQPETESLSNIDSSVFTGSPTTTMQLSQKMIY